LIEHCSVTLLKFDQRIDGYVIITPIENENGTKFKEHLKKKKKKNPSFIMLEAIASVALYII
jgi:hypothetical protein